MYLLACLLVAIGQPPDARPVAKFRERVSRDNIAVTLVHVSKLAGADLQTSDGPAASGWRVVWLIEFDELSAPPGIGEFKLTFDGVQYNDAINMASRGPFEPFVRIYELQDIRTQQPTWFEGIKTKKASVLEVLIRQPKVAPTRPGVASLIIGLMPNGEAPTRENLSHGVRLDWVWWSASMPWP